MNTADTPDIDGLDEFMSAPASQTMVMGITPTDTPRPAFTLRPLPPRMRTRTLMKAQYDELPGGEQKLIGFKPETVQETIEGGYLLRCMKGHSVAIDSLDTLRELKLGEYVSIINTKDADGGVVAHLPVSAVIEQPRNRKSATSTA